MVTDCKHLDDAGKLVASIEVEQLSASEQVALAQAEALVALARQQQIANLIALAQSEGVALYAPRKEAIAALGGDTSWLTAPLGA